MSYIRKLDNKEFLYHHEIRSAYPDIDFPEIITDDMLEDIGIYKETPDTFFEDISITEEVSPLPEELV